jgi:hypothetical protein
MPASENNIISVADYNAIRTNVISVMGVGSGTRGYGQSINSVARSVNARISQADWDNLRFDLLNARIHQHGLGTLTEINENQTVGAGTINLYEALRTTIDDNRFALADGQFLTIGANANNTVLTTSRDYNNSPWKNEIECTLTVTFADANRARYFFNSGSTVRIQSSRSNGLRTDDQNLAWTSLLNDAGLREFGGQIPNTGFSPPNSMDGRNFYRLTSEFQEFFSLSSSSTYSENRYVLEARCNVTNNSSGTANIVFIRVRFIDGYTDPGDSPSDDPRTDDGVDGTFAVSVTEKRAESIGGFLPSGNFSIQRPTYSITTLSGS